MIMSKKTKYDDFDEDFFDDSDQVLSRTVLPDDEEIVLPSIRPRKFDEFVGQASIVEKLRIFIAAARERNEPLDHTLLLGPPGLGKRRWQILLRLKWVFKLKSHRALF